MKLRVLPPVVALGVVGIIAGSALSAPQQKPAAPKPATPAKIACAVETEDMVDVKAATAKKMYADYKGNRYFFCCPGCPAEFKKDPEKFAKNAHIKTPAPAKNGIVGKKKAAPKA